MTSPTHSRPASVNPFESTSPTQEERDQEIRSSPFFDPTFQPIASPRSVSPLGAQLNPNLQTPDRGAPMNWANINVPRQDMFAPVLDAASTTSNERWQDAASVLDMHAMQESLVRLEAQQQQILQFLSSSRPGTPAPGIDSAVQHMNQLVGLARRYSSDVESRRSSQASQAGSIPDELPPSYASVIAAEQQPIASSTWRPPVYGSWVQPSSSRSVLDRQPVYGQRNSYSASESSSSHSDDEEVSYDEGGNHFIDAFEREGRRCSEEFRRYSDEFHRQSTDSHSVNEAAAAEPEPSIPDLFQQAFGLLKAELQALQREGEFASSLRRQFVAGDVEVALTSQETSRMLRGVRVFGNPRYDEQSNAAYELASSAAAEATQRALVELSRMMGFELPRTTSATALPVVSRSAAPQQPTEEYF